MPVFKRVNSYVNRFCNKRYIHVKVVISPVRPQNKLFHTSMKLTYSMVQSPSWEANWFAASQEIPRISRNPTVHYRTHKRPPPVSILGQPNPVHIPTSNLLEIHSNIIHPSMPRSPQWSPSLRFPQQDPTHPPLLTHSRHMPSPSHSTSMKHIDKFNKYLFIFNSGVTYDRCHGLHIQRSFY